VKEVKGDLWTYAPAESVVRCITTNGFVKKSGEAVMGAGCAKEATQQWPVIAHDVGLRITNFGNKVQDLGEYFDENDRPVNLAMFPVKHNWWEKADLALIEQSCKELLALAAMYPHSTVFVIPRPGCGNGKLRWEDVRPVLLKYFDADDRFHVITW
jgi:hypothetical protein